MLLRKRMQKVSNFMLQKQTHAVSDRKYKITSEVGEESIVVIRESWKGYFKEESSRVHNEPQQ